MLPASEQDISPPTCMMAATLVRMAHPTNENLHNALSKAETRLFTHAWDVSGGVLRIESESGVGTFRHTDGDTCDCPTRKYICWHRGAHFILSVLAAAMIAPIRSHFEPLGQRQPAAAAVEDPASMGNFLDRPELAGEEIEDVPFTDQLAAIDAGLDRVEASVTHLEAELIELKAPESESAAERAAMKAYAGCKPGTHPWDARNTAYEAARATGAGYTEANKAADRAVRLLGEDHLNARVTSNATSLDTSHDSSSSMIFEPIGDTGHRFTPSPASGKLGMRAGLNDKALEERLRLAEVPRDRPEEYLWNTADYAEEDHESEDKKAEKIVPTRKRAESPPDPFEDVL